MQEGSTMNVSVSQVGPEAALEVLGLVARLLEELGEEGDEAGTLNAGELAAAWRANEPRHRVFLAHAADGRAVGVATLTAAFAVYAGGEYGIINEMYVVPEHRSEGVGGLLIEAIKDHARTLGWRRLDVTAPESARWSRTREFYERHGFVFTGPKLKLLLA
jgi:GNAT superfamily N-acetyltransferase